jgi:uncharacterized membrane protein YdbT with pleckstrin-like domain
MIEIDKDEHIIFEVRKHWLVFGTEMTFLIILALIPLILTSFISNSGINFGAVMSAVDIISLFSFFYALWLLVIWVIAFIIWTNYYLDIWIITSKKIIDIEQYGLFKRQVSILHLEKIQDITYDVHGLLQTFFQYGDLMVQTAGSSGSFPIKGVPNPALVQAKLNEAIIFHKKNQKD